MNDIYLSHLVIHRVSAHHVGIRTGQRLVCSFTVTGPATPHILEYGYTLP